MTPDEHIKALKKALRDLIADGHVPDIEGCRFAMAIEYEINRLEEFFKENQ